MRETFVVTGAAAAIMGAAVLASWGGRVAIPGVQPPLGERTRVLGETFPRTVVEDGGYRTRIVRPPRRIVSTALLADEMILDLVGPDRMRAVTPFAHDPTLSNVTAAAARVPPLGLPDVERVIALEPDLVVTARFTAPEFVALLREAGVPVLRVDQYQTLAEIRESLLLLGRVLGAEREAERLAAEMDARLARVRAIAAAARARPRVLYYTLSGYTIGGGTVFDEILAAAGGVNGAAAIGIAGYQKIALEAAVVMDPDAILVPADRTDAFRTGEAVRKMFSEDAAWRDVRAVRAGRIHVMPAQTITAVSHHVAKAAEEILRVLHPDLAARGAEEGR